MRYPPLGLGSVALGVTSTTRRPSARSAPGPRRRRGRSGGSSGSAGPGPALPTAQQSSAARHCTFVSWSYVLPGWSTGDDGVQAAPFHCSITSLRLSPADVGRVARRPYSSTPTCSSRPGGAAPTTRHRSGSGWARSTSWSRSNSRSGCPTGLPVRRPDSFEDGPHRPAVRPVHAGDVEEAPAFAGREGRRRGQGPRRAVPGLDERGEYVPLELMFSMETPTAQHWKALAHVDPSRTSSAPVPGTVAMFQPEGAAPAAVCPRTPAAPITSVRSDAAKASVHRARRWATRSSTVVLVCTRACARQWFTR